MEFVGTIAQTMGPEALASLINPEEFLKRLAAALARGPRPGQEPGTTRPRKEAQKMMQSQVMGRSVSSVPMAEK